jgi:hypothetical protein
MDVVVERRKSGVKGESLLSLTHPVAMGATTLSLEL